MDEMNLTLPPELEAALNEFYSAPAPDVAFAAGLEKELRHQHKALRASPAEAQSHSFSKWSAIMQTLRARPALTILMVLLSLALLTGVVYAVSRSLGYIPGVGLIDQSAPLRVLAEPVTVERAGVSITVKEAVLSADKTVLFVKIEGVPADAYPKSEIGGCLGKADISLPDGTILEGGHISGGNWNTFESRLEYGPIPARLNKARILIACIGDTTPGVLPENWNIPVSFKPAPPDMTVAPVVELSTPVVKITPAPDITSTPVLSNTDTHNGITFTLEKYVEIEGGYQLYGSLDWKNLSLPAQGYFNGLGLLQLTDSKGNRIPLEEASSEPPENNIYDPTRISWIYRTNQKAFAGHLVLSLPSLSMEINPQTSFELDLGSDPQIGQTWEINRDLDFAGRTVRLLTAQLTQSDNPQWASILKFTYEDKEGGVFINVMDDVPQKPLIEVAGGGGGGGPLAGVKLASMDYGEIPSGLRRFTISANVPYRINGPWQVVWNPPATSDLIPTPAPEACLNSKKWQQLAAQDETLPTGLSGKVLFTTEGMSPEINIFRANLDGSDVQGLISAYYPALSPDGKRMVFMSENVSLNILDLNNGKTVSLGTGTIPVWSPDGQRILFQNPPDGLYLVNADGTDLQKIETGSPRIQPVGWLPDNQTIVFGAQAGDIHNLYEHMFKSFNLQTGDIKSLFPIAIKTAAGAVSPDGQWIAFNDRVFGANPNGAVFISRLDGSERKLVAMLDEAFAFHPMWGPESSTGSGDQWLIVNVSQPNKPVSPVLVNPFTCQVILLNGLGGEIQSWVK